MSVFKSPAIFLVQCLATNAKKKDVYLPYGKHEGIRRVGNDRGSIKKGNVAFW